MQTCENCGASFEPNDSVVEVTSLRILCPTCLAERKAAKARKAALQAQAPGRAASSETPAPRARPSAGHAPSAHAPGTGASRPAARPEDKTGSPALRADGAARPRPAASARSEAPAPAATPAAPASPPPVPARKAVKGSSKKKQRVETHSSEEIKKKSSREVLVASLIAFVILAVAGGALYMAYVKKTREDTAEREKAEKIETFRSTFMAMEMTTEDGAKALIAFGEENKPQWETQEFAG
ncbi:MAG TPA: hypothetical protein VF414_12375, partial [Thermoanaerobaculia bacterium]